MACTACHVRVFFGFIFVNLQRRASPSTSTPRSRILRPILISMALPTRSIAYSQVLPDRRQLETGRRKFCRVLSLRAGASGVLLHASARGARGLWRRPEFRAGRCRERYLPTRASVGTARRPRSADPSARWMMAPHSSHLRLLLQRTVRDGYETETARRPAGLDTDGQTARLRPGTHVPVLQPVHPGGRDQ